jgi:mono/diheme cytochrome c family protein
VRWLCLAGALLLGAGCEYYETPRFQSPQRLGGVLVPAEVLTRGAKAYMRACRPCHGANGDGHGPQAVGQDPPPRDLRLGIVAFGSAPSGSLWRDEDIYRIVRGGLNGTGMRAWSDVSEDDLAAIIEFVKTLSPRFRVEVPQPAVEASPDPWAGREPEAAQRGRAVYHGVARCQACHPAYATADEVKRLARDAGVLNEPRRDAMSALEVASDFGRPVRATDFKVDPLRAVRLGHRDEDLYRSIAAGIGGTAMPTWKGALPEADLWALVHYVDKISRGEPVGPTATDP